MNEKCTFDMAHNDEGMTMRKDGGKVNVKNFMMFWMESSLLRLCVCVRIHKGKNMLTKKKLTCGFCSTNPACRYMRATEDKGKLRLIVLLGKFIAV